MSSLDIFASALGAFILISIVLMPYYLKKTRIHDMDIVFVMDTTGSMADEIGDLTKNLIGIISILKKLSPSLRMGFVAYRDEGKEEYVTKTFDLKLMNKTNMSGIYQFVSSLVADGGGDVPEAVHIAVKSAINMAWRKGDKNVLKHIIVIGDAPAHDADVEKMLQNVKTFHSQSDKWRVSAIFSGDTDNRFFQILADAGGGDYIFEKGRIMESILLPAVDIQ